MLFSENIFCKRVPRPLAKLRNLKLRHTRIGENGLSCVFECCPHLSRLDVSFTLVRQATFFSSMKPDCSLQKLSITSTPSMSTFFNVLFASPSPPILFSLRTLHIGALGSSSYSGGIPGSLTFTDQTLDLLTNYLVQCKYLENISLVGNSKLGLMSSRNSALKRFCTKVGRRCKVNFDGIPCLFKW